MDTIIGFFQSMHVLSIKIGLVTSAIGSIFAYFIGWNDMIETMIVFMSIDYLTGIIAAYLNPNTKLDSRKGMQGFLKKMLIICLVTLAHELDKIMGNPGIESITTWFFIANEGLSIIENAAKAGLPIPDKLKYTLAQIAEEKDKEERK